jgi:hypothetical protein
MNAYDETREFPQNIRRSSASEVWWYTLVIPALGD